MRRGGQVTIFIIVSIVLVVGLSLLFLFKKDIVPKIGGGTKEINPSAFMKSCMYDKIQDTVDIMLNQGGFVNNPLSKKFKFSDEDEYSNISLLCYTPDYYKPCINQNPMYIKQVKQEFKEELSMQVEECFDNLIENLKKEYESVESNYNDFSINFRENMIILDISAKIITTKAGEIKKYENFTINYPTMFYSLLLLAQEISNQQAEFCYFNVDGFMATNTNYYIREFVAGDSVQIFRVKYKPNDEEIKFAIRGCVYPAGL